MNDRTNQITIRTAVSADVPLILQFVRELAEYERAPEQVVATAASLEQHLFGSSFPHAGGHRGPVAECLIGEINGEPQGFALWFMNFSTWNGAIGLYLEDLFVRPTARRCGLGRALLAQLAHIAVARGAKRFEWSVLDWNESAIAFYNVLGAKPQSEWTVFRMSGAALESLAGECVGSPRSPAT